MCQFCSLTGATLKHSHKRKRGAKGTDKCFTFPPSLFSISVHVVHLSLTVSPSSPFSLTFFCMNYCILFRNELFGWSISCILNWFLHSNVTFRWDSSSLLSLSVCPPPGTMSPPLGPPYLDVPYPSKSDKRLYLGKSSTLPAQENTTPGRCAEMVNLPGGATPTHQQRWSNPGESSPAWGTIQHTCRRPLTEYRVYSHEFSTPPGKEWDGRQQPEMTQSDSLKRDRKPQIPPNVPRSVTEVDLSEPNVSLCCHRIYSSTHKFYNYCHTWIWNQPDAHLMVQCDLCIYRS